MKKRKKKFKPALIILLLALLLAVGGLGAYLYITISNQTEPFYLAADKPYLELRDEEGNIAKLPRGLAVDIKRKHKVIDDVDYRQFEHDAKTYYVYGSDLVTDRQDCVREKTLYALRDHVLCADYDDYHITGWVKKKQVLSVDSYHELLEDGTVDHYHVNGEGYISSKYAAVEYVETELDPSIYDDVFYGMAGSPDSIDYYSKDTVSFTDNAMPDPVRALYINAEAVSAADGYIELARESGAINAFVVDIKDCYIDTQLAYDSPVAAKYAPSTANIPNSLESYKENIRKLKDAGFYLIGRITAFKDDAFAVDNPDESLQHGGELYRYGSVYWPSVFSRKMWEYDVALALEAVEEFGFNEIQFDYIRFPEDADEDVEAHNIYDETRAQAVTNFLRYAVECLHDHNVYVSADVFGETSGDDPDSFSCFVAYYGQFWPAVSNAVDVISSMPYPDHFGYGYYGIDEPWAYPGDLMYAWGRATYHAQEKTYDPAKCRTWIMAQDSDPYDVYYGPDFIKGQIDGLKEAGVYDGYMTWNAASSLNKYRSYVDVYD